MEQDFLARRENVERLMVVRERERHTQISVIEDNVLVEHYVSDIQEVATVGNIYLGRVQNVLPSMEAAFVDIGQARNGVLYAGEVNWDSTRLEGQPRRIELAFKSGDPVLVQVTKDPIGHKGARLTSQVTLAGRFLVLVPSGGMTGVSRKLSERERSRLKGIVSKIAPKDMGVIIRTAAEGASEEAIVKDLETLVHQWERITAKRDEFLHGKRPKLLQGEPDVAIRVVRDIFNDDFDKMIVEGDKVYARIEEYLDTILNRIAISRFQVKNLVLTGSQLELVAQLCEAKKAGIPYQISVKKLTSLYQSIRSATAESIANRFNITEERAALLYTSLSIYNGMLRFCPQAENVISPPVDISEAMLRYQLVPKADATLGTYLRESALACAQTTAQSFGCNQIGRAHV